MTLGCKPAGGIRMKINPALFFVIALFLVGCGNAQKYDRPSDQGPYYPEHHYSPYYHSPYYHYYSPYYYRHHHYRRSCGTFTNTIYDNTAAIY